MAWKFYTTLGAVKTSILGLLSSLSDVVLTAPADNDLLAYDTASGKWINQTKTAAGFGTIATQSDGDKGDIVVSGSGAVWTVDADAVTYAKIQNVSATDKLLGRSTVGAGDIEEIACTAAGRAILDDADAAAQRTTLGLGTAAVKNTGTSGNTVPLLDGANIFSANQIIESSSAGSTGPVLSFQHNSASPAVGDNTAIIIMQGKNSSAANIEYLTILSQLTDPTAGTEDSTFIILTYAAGVQGSRIIIGAGLYTPGATGGDKGANTINASAVYDDNVLLTCYAIEAETTGKVTKKRWDTAVPNLEVEAQAARTETRKITKKVTRLKRVRENDKFVERGVEVDEPIYDSLPVFNLAGDQIGTEQVARTEQIVIAPAQPARIETRSHVPAAKFAARAAELLDPALYAAKWKADGHLPAMPSPAEWDASGKKMGMGDILQRLWETTEVQAIHIEKLRAAIVALGGTV